MVFSQLYVAIFTSHFLALGWFLLCILYLNQKVNANNGRTYYLPLLLANPYYSTSLAAAFEGGATWAFADLLNFLVRPVSEVLEAVDRFKVIVHFAERMITWMKGFEASFSFLATSFSLYSLEMSSSKDTCVLHCIVSSSLPPPTLHPVFVSSLYAVLCLECALGALHGRQHGDWDGNVGDARRGGLVRRRLDAASPAKRFLFRGL